MKKIDIIVVMDGRKNIMDDEHMIICPTFFLKEKEE